MLKAGITYSCYTGPIAKYKSIPACRQKYTEGNYSMIFDTHTHYDDHIYDEDREAVLNGLKDANVGMICNIGADMQGSRDTAALAAKYPFIYGTAGVHPDEVGALNDELYAELRELAGKPKMVAVGEIGLDYHGFGVFESKPDKDTQKYWFRKQLDLAHELNLPVVIHSRNAAEDTFEIMEEYQSKGLIKCAVIHCFSYSKELAAKYLDMGYYIGVGGVLTYEGQKKLTKVVEMLPMDRLLLETDCPYLTPVPIRKDRERNLSGYLNFVVDKISEIKGLDSQEIEDITWKNAHLFYGIDNKQQDII